MAGNFKITFNFQAKSLSTSPAVTNLSTKDNLISNPSDPSNLISGTVITIGQDVAKIVQNNTVSVLHAPSIPSCWEMSETFGTGTINWAKRRAYTAMSFFLGIFFAIAGAAGAFYSLRRLSEKRPHQENIAHSFGLK